VKYLLDTNAIIQLIRGHPSLTARLTQQKPGDCAISSIVLHELFYGAYKSTRPDENLRRIEAMRFEILDFDREDARHAGQLRAILAAAGAPIDPYDALIAGQAAARALTLVTHNTREFSRIKNFAVEDWEV